MSEESGGTPAPDVTPDTQTSNVPVEDAAKSAEPKSKKTDPAPAAEPKAEERTYKIKVNGKERVVNEKTAIAYLQRELAADEKFRQASAEANKIKSILEGAKKDPDKLFREILGMDPLEYSKKRIGDEIKRMAMTPEQRELEEAKARLAEYDRKEKERAEAERRASEEKARDFYVKKYDEEIPVALKAAGLPVNEDTVRYAAEVMLANIEEGLDLPYEMVMELVKDKYHKSLKGFLSGSDRERLLELLGDESLEELLKIREAKKNPQKAKPTMAIQQGDPEARDPATMSKDDFREYVKQWSKK